jgi:hypothetical protein
MCGSTAAQDQLQGEQLQAYQQAQQLTAEQYANQQALYAPMAAQFQSILSRGPNSKGFSDEEEQALNAQAVEGTAENYEGAAKAVNENLAAEGGGSNPLPSGAQTQLREQVATSSAQEESREEQQIQQADYSQGYNEWENAGAGLESIAAGENPLGYEGAETSSGSAAGTTAEQIAQEENSWENAAIGAVGTVAGGWATGGFKTP